MAIERETLNMVIKECRDYQEVKERYEKNKKSLEERLAFEPDFGPVQREYQEVLERYQETHEQVALEESGPHSKKRRKQDKKMLHSLLRLAKRTGLSLEEEEGDLSLRVDRLKSNVETYLELLYTERVLIPLMEEKEQLDYLQDRVQKIAEIIFPVCDLIPQEKKLRKTNKN